MIPRAVALLGLLVVGADAHADPPTHGTQFPDPSLPEIAVVAGTQAIAFDDVGTDPVSGAVFVPAGIAGSVARIDPETHHVDRWGSFAARADRQSPYVGPTSVDFAPGYLLVVDRTSRTLDVLDMQRHARIAQIALADIGEYVRFVATTREAWVTEPHAHAIQVIDLAPLLDHHAPPAARAMITMAGDPEALIVDLARSMAYTNLPSASLTLAIDLTTRAVRSRWTNGCAVGGARGLALDAARGFLFVACADGALSVMDTTNGPRCTQAQDGHTLSHGQAGAGVGIVAYDSTLHHLYVPAGEAQTLAVFGVDANGVLASLRVVAVGPHAHCVGVDRLHTAYVCDPARGRFFFFEDTLPPS